MLCSLHVCQCLRVQHRTGKLHRPQTFVCVLHCVSAAVPRLLWLPLRVILTNPARPLRQHSNHMPEILPHRFQGAFASAQSAESFTKTRCVSLQAPAPGMEASCTLTTELEEGPYYLDDILFRSNITEDQIGIPLVLRIKVVNTDCEPLADTFVDIWHCNGTGFYSGYTRESLVHLLHGFSLARDNTAQPTAFKFCMLRAMLAYASIRRCTKSLICEWVIPGCLLSLIHSEIQCLRLLLIEAACHQCCFLHTLLLLLTTCSSWTAFTNDPTHTCFQHLYIICMLCPVWHRSQSLCSCHLHCFSSCTFNAAHLEVSNHTPSLTAVTAGAGDSGQTSATEASAVTPSGSASTPSGAPSGTSAPSSEAAPSGTMATTTASSPEGSTSAGSSTTSSGGQTSTVTDTLTWLRGIVQTDEDGIAEFETIVPGWYSGRAPHIHIKVIACGSQSTCASLVAHIDHFLSHFVQILYRVSPLL